MRKISIYRWIKNQISCTLALFSAIKEILQKLPINNHKVIKRKYYQSYHSIVKQFLNIQNGK
jgi:hypothetical protein